MGSEFVYAYLRYILALLIVFQCPSVLGTPIASCRDQSSCLRASVSESGSQYRICMVYDDSLSGCQESGSISWACTTSTLEKEVRAGTSLCQTVDCGQLAAFAFRDGPGCSSGAGMNNVTLSGISGISCGYAPGGSYCQKKNGRECLWRVPAPECGVPTTGEPTRTPTGYEFGIAEHADDDDDDYAHMANMRMRRRLGDDKKAKKADKKAKKEQAKNDKKAKKEDKKAKKEQAKNDKKAKKADKKAKKEQAKNDKKARKADKKAKKHPTTAVPTTAVYPLPLTRLAAQTDVPTSSPTPSPAGQPTVSPTSAPTDNPTSSPTRAPTGQPTVSPTSAPTDNPTSSPTRAPTGLPTENPTSAPTDNPTSSPTPSPTGQPTVSPTSAPTDNPTEAPTVNPTVPPTSPIASSECASLSFSIIDPPLWTTPTASHDPAYCFDFVVTNLAGQIEWTHIDSLNQTTVMGSVFKGEISADITEVARPRYTQTFAVTSSRGVLSSIEIKAGPVGHPEDGRIFLDSWALPVIFFHSPTDDGVSDFYYLTQNSSADVDGFICDEGAVGSTNCVYLIITNFDTVRSVQDLQLVNLDGITYVSRVPVMDQSEFHNFSDFNPYNDWGVVSSSNGTGYFEDNFVTNLIGEFNWTDASEANKMGSKNDGYIGRIDEPGSRPRFTQTFAVTSSRGVLCSIEIKGLDAHPDEDGKIYLTSWALPTVYHHSTRAGENEKDWYYVVDANGSATDNGIVCDSNGDCVFDIVFADGQKVRSIADFSFTTLDGITFVSRDAEQAGVSDMVNFYNLTEFNPDDDWIIPPQAPDTPGYYENSFLTNLIGEFQWNAASESNKMGSKNKGYIGRIGEISARPRYTETFAVTSSRGVLCSIKIQAQIAGDGLGDDDGKIYLTSWALPTVYYHSIDSTDGDTEEWYYITEASANPQNGIICDGSDNCEFYVVASSSAVRSIADLSFVTLDGITFVSRGYDDPSATATANHIFPMENAEMFKERGIKVPLLQRTFGVAMIIAWAAILSICIIVCLLQLGCPCGCSKRVKYTKIQSYESETDVLSP